MIHSGQCFCLKSLHSFTRIDVLIMIKGNPPEALTLSI
jgi:hypothetical protein